MSKITLIITGNGEQYTYDAATDTMIGTGNSEKLEVMNNLIEIADYGDNPYQQIAEMMRSIGYKVQYEYIPNPEVVDGI